MPLKAPGLNGRTAVLLSMWTSFHELPVGLVLEITFPVSSTPTHSVDEGHESPSSELDPTGVVGQALAGPVGFVEMR